MKGLAYVILRWKEELEMPNRLKKSGYYSNEYITQNFIGKMILTPSV